MSASMDVYSFDTLWREATQAVGYTFSAIFGGMSDIFGTRAYYNTEQKKYEEQRKITNFETLANSGKTGNTIVLIGFLSMIAIIAYVIYSKNKK